MSLALLASFVVAMTVIPLFCSKFLKAVPGHAAGHENDAAREAAGGSLFDRFNRMFNRGFNKLLDAYERTVRWALKRPALTVFALAGLFVCSLGIYPFLGLAFFPRTDAGQFTINLKVPTGTRIEMTDQYVAKVEDLIRHTVDPHDMKMIVSNIGVVPDFSALYTTNAGPYTATVQVALSDEHKVSSFEYIDRVREELGEALPRCPDLLLERFDGGRHPEHRHAGADRHSGEQQRPAAGLRHCPGSGQPVFGNCRASARSTFRRI